jgi:thioredoxin 1
MILVLSRRSFVIAAAMLPASHILAQTVAAPSAKYSQAAFDTAQSTGKSILIEVSAPWCPVCKVQKPIIAALVEKPDYANVQVFVVDFDSQKDLLQKFGVAKQSTLIAFKGSKEMKRLVGETKPEVIEDLMKSSI